VGKNTVQVKPVHTDDPSSLPPCEGFEAVRSKATVANEHAARPLCLTLDFAHETQHVSLAGLLVVPFRFDQINIVAMLKTAVDLFTNKAKRTARS
jgi:hypothetical protein